MSYVMFFTYILCELYHRVKAPVIQKRAQHKIGTYKNGPSSLLFATLAKRFVLYCQGQFQ